MDKKDYREETHKLIDKMFDEIQEELYNDIKSMLNSQRGIGDKTTLRKFKNYMYRVKEIK